MGLIFESLLSDLIFLLVSGVILFYYYVVYKQSYFKRQGFPHVKPTWFLGSNYKPFFLMEGFEWSLDDMYKKLKGNKVGGFYSFLSPSYIVCHPELAQRVLIKDFSNFHDHGFQVDENLNPLDGNLFNMNGNKWRALRNKLSPAFTSGKLKWMFPEMNKCGNSMIKYLDNKATEEDYAIRDVCSRYGMDVIASCAFGLETDCINNPDNDFTKVANLVFRPPIYRLLISFLRLTLPSLFIKLKLKPFDPKVEEFFFTITKQGFEHRLKTGEKRNDFVQLLLQLRERGSIEVDPRDNEDEGPLEVDINEKLEFTDALLTAQSFIFFAAGFEPSASLMSYCLYTLSKYPEFQKAARDEIHNMKKKHGELNYDALKDCNFLEACVSEILRMYPPNFGLFRKCTKSFTLDDGYKIEKGTALLIPTYSFHFDPEYFEDPDEFKPSRFLDGEKPIPGSYLPFGEGPRICIARRFALLQAKLGIARVLDHYEVFHSTKNQEPLVRNFKSFILEPVGGLWVKLKKIETKI